MSLLRNGPAQIDEMDRVLLSTVASAGRVGNRNLVMKGGTLLRACDKEARYSEDLDFDWVGSLPDFYSLINRVLDDVRENSDIEFNVSPKRRTLRNLIVGWRTNSAKGSTKIEVIVLNDKTEVPPTRMWNVDVGRYGSTQRPAKILGYTRTSIAADKLSCVATREKARDLYDLVDLSKHTECDLRQAWSRYTKQFNNPARVREPRHPISILDNFETREQEFEQLWRQDIQQGLLPPDANFKECADYFKGLVEPYVTHLRKHFTKREIRRIGKKRLGQS